MLVERRLWAVLIAVTALFLLALVPRVLNGPRFVTPDEDNWMRRTGNFARALERGSLERTYQSGHPGVTTMWVAWLGIGSEASRLAGITAVSGPVTRLPEFPELVQRARIGLGVANAGLLTLIALLAWRLLGPGPGALAGLLMAFDPFLIAHSQIVHLDALGAGLMTASMLAGVVYWWDGGGRAYLVLCGVTAGLGVLTKAPSLFLAAFLPILAFGAHLSPWPPWSKRPVARTSWRELGAGGMRKAVLDLAICAVAALATIVALWPALWVAPVETVRRAVEYQLLTAGAPHGPGNFFLGQPTADPGPLFYPLALAFRLAPMVVVGLAAVAILLPPPALRLWSLLLVGFVVGFSLLLVVASKKLDRYALPLFPVLAILAGLGLSSMWVVGRRLLPGVDARPSVYAGLAILVVGLGQVAALVPVRAYPLAYYNPLLGGGRTAERALLVGWGEGLDQVADFLNEQPEADASHIAIYYPQVLNFQALVRGTVLRYGDPRPADWIVDYVSAAQRGHTPSEVAGRAPRRVVRINGIDYARVYQLSPSRPVGVRFAPIEEEP